MNRITLFRIFTALVLVGAMLALGIFAYQAGLARGMAVVRRAAVFTAA